MSRVFPNTAGVVQIGRPVVQGTVVGVPQGVQMGTPVRAATGTPTVQGRAIGSGGSPVIQATVISQPVRQEQPVLVRPSMMVMDSTGNVVHLHGWSVADHDSEQDDANLLCLQLATAYACCCPCGTCVGAFVWAKYKNEPEGSAQRQWAYCALGAGFLNLAANLAMTMLRASAI
eukprot:TRINITY_DN50579_c0_g1_i1.p1 TRINITY_DN50579_c0_g1~~TRINITY_DN50579_c0_g1_i1.p1  ORF type:complete len:174 (-),score=20.84 TRINITY_DN50579_c0_g1_i1:43-564(-)